MHCCTARIPRQAGPQLRGAKRAREDSNPNRSGRNRLLYPLSYGRMMRQDPQAPMLVRDAATGVLRVNRRDSR